MDVTGLFTELDAAQAAYEAGANTLSAPEVRALAARIKDARVVLNATITQGANACPDCGHDPMGMRKSEATEHTPEVYEVGCLFCADHRARGSDPTKAVERWNAGPAAWVQR